MTIRQGEAATSESSEWLERTPCRVPVSGGAGWTVYGELCHRRGTIPRTVQLLVHGMTYAHDYWDFPVEPENHSYVRAATAAGYATFSVDHLGVGASTRPSSQEVSQAAVVDALSDVIGYLRDGTIGGFGFTRVVWVGHSYGSQLAWLEAARHDDVDAFVLTGLVHASKASSVAQLAFVTAALEDPSRWGALDPGYVTVPDSAREGLFYHSPTSDPAVVERDHQLKDTITFTQLSDAAAELADSDPAVTVSQRIRVPTLLVVGEHDAMFFGPPDGPTCTEEHVHAAEAPYYAPEARLAVRVIADTGHNLALHRTAPLAAEATLAWLADVVPPTA